MVAGGAMHRRVQTEPMGGGKTVAQLDVKIMEQLSLGPSLGEVAMTPWFAMLTN